MKNFNQKCYFLILLSGLLLTLQACDDAPQEPESLPDSAKITIQYSPGDPLVGQDIVFSASIPEFTVESYRWDFGDLSQSEEQSPVHVYEAKGEYRIKLTVSNSSVSTTDSILVSVGERDYGKGFLLKWISNTSVGNVKEISPVLSPDESQIYMMSDEQILKKFTVSNGL